MVKRTSHPKHSRTFRHIGLVIGIFIVLLLIGVNRIVAWNRSGGWQYTFQEKISLSKAFPQLYHSLSLDTSSAFVNVGNGFTYSINRMTGALNWRHEEQNASIYPAAFGNHYRMFLTNFDGRLYAVDTQTGKELWRFTTPGLFMADTEPQESDGLVYFGSRDGALYALDANTGALRWKFQTTPVDTSRFIPGEAILHFGRFAVDEKNVYINSSTDNAIYALDKKTGNLLWKFANYGFVFETPHILSDSIAFWNNSGTYYILSKSTGAIVFSVDAPSSRVFEADTSVYVVDAMNTISCINSSTGATLWTYHQGSVIRTSISATDPNHLAVVTQTDGSTIVKFFNAATGDILWSKPLQEDYILSVFSDPNNIYTIGTRSQCALTMKGTVRWCIDNPGIYKTIFAKTGIYILSIKNKLATITYLLTQTGTPKWSYQSDNIDIDSMQVFDGSLYFVSQDNKSIYMLNKDNPHRLIRSSNLRIVSDGSPGIYERIKNLVNRLAIQISAYFNKQNVRIETSENPISVNGVYELTLHLDESQYGNKYDDVHVSAVFSNEQHAVYRAYAFYYDKNIWKIRFAPPSAGTWKWNITAPPISQKGTFTAETSNTPGFFSISKTDPRLFVLQNGKIFIPVGIQDCSEDINQDGNPLNQWFISNDVKPPLNPTLLPTTSMETYLSTYAASGFNLFRWGAGNCSFNLWKTLSSSGNRYAVNEGIWADIIFSSLRNHGYHVWMSLFSFNKLPLAGSPSLTQKQEILKHYLTYVVARYGSMVDVWELANEIQLDDPLITFMADYIRFIDPYHHPITTNWDRSDLSSIDIASIHWYGQECDKYCDVGLTGQFASYQNTKKPFVFSEQGNLFSNWDDQSAARMRVRLWVGLFNKMFYIYWNSSGTLFHNNPGNPSNLYIGPTERQYISAFNTFTKNISGPFENKPVTATDGHAYTMEVGQQILGYIYRKIGDPDPKSSTLSIDVPSGGTVRWINPATGQILDEQPIQKDVQSFQSPSFSTDIAFILSLQ